MNRKPYTLDRIVRIVITVLILIGAGLLFHRLSSVLLPFLLAWLLAYLMYPLLNFYQKRLRLKNRMLAITATLVTVFGTLGVALWLLIPSIIDESQRAVSLITAFLNDPKNGWTLPPGLLKTIQDYLNSFDYQQYLNFENLESFVRSVLPKVWDMVSGATSAILNVFVVFIVLLYLIFILKDYEKISTEWAGLIPKQYRPFVHQVFGDLKKGMNQYFRGQGLIALTVGILFMIGFSIIGLPFGIVLGMLVGLMNMVPYLQTFAIVPAVMLGAIKAAEYHQSFFWVTVSVLSVFLVIQVIEELLLNPRILGKAMGMHPAIILLSLSIWGALFGMVGMIVALPMTTLMTSYYKRFIIEREVIEDLLSTGNEFPAEQKASADSELDDTMDT